MARNKELNQIMKDKRREQILLNAMKLFAVKGLTATKISDIATTSGFSQGLVYHYFKSKEDIYTELIKTAFDKLNAACVSLESMELPPKEKIRLAITELLKGIEKNEDAARYYLLTSQASVSDAIPEEAGKIIRNQNTLPYEIISRIMAEGQKDGSIKNHNPDELALVFWSSIKGLAIFKASYGNKFTPPDPEILMSMFIKPEIV